jgi:hypothetical protein
MKSAAGCFLFLCYAAAPRQLPVLKRLAKMVVVPENCPHPDFVNALPWNPFGLPQLKPATLHIGRRIDKMRQRAQLGALPRMAAPEEAIEPFHSGTRNPRVG